MKSVFKYLMFLISIFAPISAFASLRERPMVVMIASYNNKDWYKKNLNSVFNQDYNNFRVIYIDDCSPDRTGERVKKNVTKEKSSS